MSKTYVGIKLQDLGLYNTLDPKDKIVIVKDKDEGVLQLKDFFLYVQSNLDLSNYYTSTQADTIFMAKVDAYTRKDADLKFALVEKTYTRLQSDSRFALAADTFNKTEIEEKYASKEQMYTKDLVYTKDEAITAFALKTEIPILPDLTPYSTTAKGDLRWALKVDVFSKTEADARFANINNYYTKSESDNKYALLSNTYTKAETDNKFLDTTEAYTKDYINLNIYTKTQVYTKAETDGKYPLKTDVYTVTAVNDQFAAKSWVYSRAEADNTFRKLADSYNRAEVNALIDASKSGLSTDVSNTYYTKTDADNKFELKGTAYNKIDSDAKYALISNSISPSQVAAKYYNKTEIDKSLGDAATNTSNLFALKTAAVGGISLTPTNLTFTKVDGTSSLVAIPTWNQSTTGNAATATQLQTGRNIGITGAVTATAANFDGTSNININATSLDATKLTDIVPNASLAGTYTNVSLDISKNIIYNLNNTNSTENSGTVFGLGSIRAYGAPTGAVIVIKTSIPSDAGNVVSLQLKGLSDSETSTIDMVLSGYTLGSISKLSLGTKDYDVRKARSSDGFLCFLINHPSGNLGTSTALSVVYAHVNYLVKVNYYRNWTIYYTTDLTTFTNISDYCPQKTSVVNTFWNNVQGKPTTVAGYGITDVYTKTDIYTKTESDNRFSFKQESIRSATLNTSTLSFTKADNTVSNISIPTWNQDTSGNSATATKLATPRTINGVAFDGSGDISTPATGTVTAIDDRVMVPNDLPLRSLGVYFTSKGGLESTAANTTWGDFLTLNTYDDSFGGGVNALFFTKGSQGIYHYFTPFGSTNPFPTPKQIAYTDSDITGNAASASKWQAARNFSITGDASWSVTADGTSDVSGSLTLANSGVSAGTYTKITVDSKGRATAGSNLVPNDVPNLDMSKINTGTLGINQGGTGATTATAARSNLGLGTAALLNIGTANGVASLDSSGKVPTSQLYINNTLTSTDTTIPLTAAQGKVLNDNIGTTNNNLQLLSNRLDSNYYLKSEVFTKTEITTNYFDKTYVNNNFLAQAANKDVSIAGFINAAKDLLFTTSLTGIKWNMNTDIASIYFKNNSDADTDSYLGFDVGDTGDEYFRWSFIASSNNKVGMSLRRDKLEINNAVATLGLSTSASLTDISKIPQYGIYSKGNITTDGQIITNATSHHVNISDLGIGSDAPIRVPLYIIPKDQTGYIPYLHGSTVTSVSGYTIQTSLGVYKVNNTWDGGGMYMAIGGDDRYPTVAFRFKLDGTIDFTGGSVKLIGNAATATKLQTDRNFYLTNAAFSNVVSFNGSGDVAINVTSLDATKLSGIVPQSSISGIYKNISLDTTGGYLLSKGNNSVTGYGLGSFRNDGNLPIVVIKTTVGYNDSTVYNITIEGTTDSETNFVKLGIMGYTLTKYINKINLGGVDILVRKAKSADGFLCFILGDVGSSLGESFSFSITTAAFNFNVKDEYLKGWTFYSATDLTGLSNISDFAVNNISTVSSRWNNIVNKPTTIAGYGITDAYTKTETQGMLNGYYNSSVSDGRFASKIEAISNINWDATKISWSTPSGNTGAVSVPQWNQSTTGNAATATTLQSARTINGVAFDGSSNITITDNTKLPTTGGSLTNNIVFTNTNTGINWNMNTDNAGIYFKNDSDTDTDSYLMFNLGDNGDEYFRWGNAQNSKLMTLKNGFLWVNNQISTDTVSTRNIVASGDLTVSNNLTTNGDIVGNIKLNDSNQMIRDIGSYGSVYYGVANGGRQDEGDGFIVIQTNLTADRNGMYGIDIDVYRNYGGGGCKIYIQFYRYNGWHGAFYTIDGTVDIPVKLALLDNKIAIILGSIWWGNPHVSVSKVLAHYAYLDSQMKGWTVSFATDISGYKETTDINHATNVIKTDWNKMVNKPTTVSGYGITDTYTKGEADARYVIVDNPVIFTSVPARVQYNKPMVLDAYGLQSNRNIWITANNDNNNVPEPVIITSGKGHYPSADMGLSVYPDAVNFFGGSNRWDNSGNLTVSGTITTNNAANCQWLINKNADYHSDNVHKFRTINGTPQKVAAAGLLVSDSFGNIGSVPANGIWSLGDITTAGSITASGGFKFPNYTWNPIGDDVYVGDYNVAGTLCIKSATNGIDTGLTFFGSDNTRFGTILGRTNEFYFNKNIITTGNMSVGNTVQFNTTGSGIRWDMNSDFGRIYFKNDSNDDTNSYLGFEVGDDGNEHFKWFVSTVERMSLRSDGLWVNGSITATGDVTAFSDKRLKDNIEIVDNALEKVKQLNGVTFTRNDLEDKEKLHIGLIAQDVQTVFPEAVKQNEDGILSVNYSGLIGALVETIKEMDSKNQALEARLARLEELIK